MRKCFFLPGWKLYKHRSAAPKVQYPRARTLLSGRGLAKTHPQSYPSLQPKQHSMPPITFPALLRISLFTIAAWHIIFHPLPLSSRGPHGKFAGAPSVAARLAKGSTDLAVTEALSIARSDNRSEACSIARREKWSGWGKMRGRRTREMRRQ
jgi:hypothetical protein